MIVPTEIGNQFPKIPHYIFYILVLVFSCSCDTRMPRMRKEKLMEHTQTTQEQLTKEKMKELLIRNITFCLKKCNDISLLDLILKLLKKSI